MADPIHYPIYYDFELPGGSRSIHRLSMETKEKVHLKAIQITTNAEIKDPWGFLEEPWRRHVKVTKLDDQNSYRYEIFFDPSIEVPPGRVSLLNYTVGNALGPLTGVAMKPTNIAVLRDVPDSTWETVHLTGTASIPAPRHGKELNLYVANWGQYGHGRTASHIPLSTPSCLNYAFIGFDTAGRVFPLDPWAEQLELPVMAVARVRREHLQTSIAFGGWTNAGVHMEAIFREMAANSQSRRRFVKGAVDAAVQAQADRIDLDWEYVRHMDAENFLALLGELDAEIKYRGLRIDLTMAAPAGREVIRCLSRSQWQRVIKILRYVSIMNYDYFGGFSTHFDFHAAKKLSRHSPNFHESPCVEETFRVFEEEMGVPAHKLVHGIPNYTRAVIVQQPGPHGCLYQPVLGTPKGEYADTDGIYGWDSIYKVLNKQPSELDKLGVREWFFYDSEHPLCQEAHMCLLSGQLPDGRWVSMSFLDQKCARERGQWIVEKGLAGGMIWANYEDTIDPESSIIHAVSQGLEGLRYEEKQLVRQELRVKPIAALEKTHAWGEVATYSIELRGKFYGQPKSEILEQLRNPQHNLAMMNQILEQHRAKLEEHRNIFFWLLSFILPKSWLPRTKSIRLAESLLQARQTLEWTAPTRVISVGPIREDVFLEVPARVEELQGVRQVEEEKRAGQSYNRLYQRNDFRSAGEGGAPSHDNPSAAPRPDRPPPYAPSYDEDSKAVSAPVSAYPSLPSFPGSAEIKSFMDKPLVHLATTMLKPYIPPVASVALTCFEQLMKDHPPPVPENHPAPSAPPNPW